MSLRVSESWDRQGVAWSLFQGALFTLPWVGVGLIRLSTGRDLGAGLQPAWLLLGLVTLLQTPELIRFLRSTRPAWLPAAGPLLLALALSVAGLWLAPSGEVLSTTLWRFVKQIIQVGIMLAFVLVPAFYLARGRALAALARPVVWGALFELVYSVLQGIHFYHPLGEVASLERIFTSNPAILAGSGQLYLNNVLQQVPRLRGTVCEPLYLGSFLLLALPLIFVTGWPRRWQLVVAALLAGLLGATWSRGVWLAAGVGCVGGVVVALRSGVWTFRRSPGRWAAVAAVALALLGVVFGLPVLGLAWQRLAQSFSTADWSNLTRIYSMQAAWRAFLLSPVVGIGWGQFAFHFATLVDPMGLQSMFSWPVVNSFPLEILCETGLVGGGGLLWLTGRIWGRCRGRLVWGDPTLRGDMVLLALSVVAIWLQLLTFSQYNLPHLWVAMGLLIGTLASPSAASGKDSA